MKRSSLYGEASIAPISTASFAKLKEWLEFVASYPLGMKIAGWDRNDGTGILFPSPTIR